MKIILLSGGSGERLWPVGNDARSKQFLPFFEAPDGRDESMLQRVVRQLAQSGLADDVTILANQAQRDILSAQLGLPIEPGQEVASGRVCFTVAAEQMDSFYARVRVLCEPCRRGTFGAALLACRYLLDKTGCSADETVVVMPCDPYCESSYYDIIRLMVADVESRRCDIALMGIRPDYASPFLGYILPEHTGIGDCRRVEGFVDRPATSEAERLIAEGAFWNGGVDVFRLSTLLKLAEVQAETPCHQVFGNPMSVNEAALDYEGLKAAYFHLEPKKFEPELLTLSQRGLCRCAMREYHGLWKDLGSWKDIADGMTSPTRGNVALGQHAVNCQVVNELKLPILVEGLSDVVVAANPDGILVCGKPYAHDVPRYAHSLKTRPMYEERRWGRYHVLDESDYGDYRSLTKILVLNPGKYISYQIHHHRDEVWTFTSGEGRLVIDGVERRVGRGDVVHIRQGQRHAVMAVTELQIIEVQMGDHLVEEDIERFDWQW